jgi:hypothetical protein
VSHLTLAVSFRDGDADETVVEEAGRTAGKAERTNKAGVKLAPGKEPVKILQAQQQGHAAVASALSSRLAFHAVDCDRIGT